MVKLWVGYGWMDGWIIKRKDEGLGGSGGMGEWVDGQHPGA